MTDNETDQEAQEISDQTAAEAPTQPVVAQPEPEQEVEQEPPEEQDPPPQPNCPPCKSGAPGWMATFADMATLLMAFFVLLLSFAEMNVPKYKEVSGSMKDAFGVQRLVPVVEPPKAKSIIAKQYKTAKVDPTLMDVIQEQTTDELQPVDPDLQTETKNNEFDTNADIQVVSKALAKEIAMGKVSVRVEDHQLVVRVSSDSATGTDGDSNRANAGAKISQDNLQIYAKVASAQAQVASQVRVAQASPDRLAANLAEQAKQDKQRAIADQYQRLRMDLSNEITQGLAEVELEGDNIIVRLAERGSFRSGYAKLQPGFIPLLNKVAGAMSDSTGLITIEGHTDNVPMAFSERFRSNWDLSAARSAAVADYLLNNTAVDNGRVNVTGFADTRPLASNDTAQGRARNRRIEVIINGG